MNQQLTLDAADRLFLTRAIELGARGMFSVTANPRVGCVLVKSGELLGRGYHQQAGNAHAEVNALRDALLKHSPGDIAGSTAYVSLEPCCHAGRTPACTGALIEAGVKRVVVAMLDPHPKVAGEGANILRAAGVQVDVAPEDGAEYFAAQRLNYGHTQRMLFERPYVRIKVAQSLDGRTAMASGESKWITGTLARRDVQYWRARSGAVVTGVGTVIADDPSLTVRESQLEATIDGKSTLRQPLRVVLDTQQRAPLDSALFNDGHPTLWAVGPNSGPDSGSGAGKSGDQIRASTELYRAQQTASGERLDIKAVLSELARRGCNEVLIEAGSALVSECLRRDIWDELVIYTAPKLLGSDARPTADLQLSTMSQAIEAKIATVDTLGADVRTRLVRLDRKLETIDRVPLGVPDDFFEDA